MRPSYYKSPHNCVQRCKPNPQRTQVQQRSALTCIQHFSESADRKPNSASLTQVQQIIYIYMYITTNIVV